MVTILIILFTSIVSYSAFNRGDIIQKYLFYPKAIKNNEWYRFITYGFLHADFSHLLFNMFALYLFGSAIEKVFLNAFGSVFGIILYILLYILALIFSIIPTWLKEKNNSSYRSLGASGAVSAIVFAYILVYPMSYMGIIFIPVFLPAFIFGIIYIVASIYLDRNQRGTINHLAHISGGVFGVIFMFIIFLAFNHVNILEHFIHNIQIQSIKDIVRVGY